MLRSMKKKNSKSRNEQYTQTCKEIKMAKDTNAFFGRIYLKMKNMCICAFVYILWSEVVRN